MIRAIAGVGLAACLCGCPAEQTAGTAMPGMPGMTAAMPGMTAAMPGTAVPMPATVAAAEPTSAELPVPEDFEQEAATSVQEANFRAELDRIAREIETSQ